mgnify:FL=1
MMAGIEDLTNIMMAGGRPDIPMAGPQGPPMPPPPQGAPMPPPQGAPMPPPQGGMPPMPPTMAEQMPMEEQEMSVEQDAAALAEAVIGRAGGDPQAAVAILDTAAQMIMQSTQEEPMMAAGGGYMKKPQYANQGKYLEDEADELRQMIMEGSRAGAAAAEEEGRDPRFRDYQPEGSLKGTLFDYIPDPIQLSSFLMDRFGQEGRTLTQKEASQPRDRLQEFFDAYEKDPDAFSKDAIEADAVEEERRKAAQRAAAYRSR